jgi:hypothetical protein
VKKDTLYKLSSDQIPEYEIGDTLIYKSNWNNQDTFIVTIKSIWQECNDDENYCNTETCQEILGITYSHINVSNTDSNAIIAYNEGAKFKWRGRIRFRGFGMHFYEVEKEHYSFLDTIFDGHNISHAVKMMNSNEYLNTDIKQILYSHKYGVLYYENKDGEKWDLQPSN